MPRVIVTDTTEAMKILRNLSSKVSPDFTAQDTVTRQKYVSVAGLVAAAVTQNNQDIDRGWLGRTLHRASREGVTGNFQVGIAEVDGTNYYRVFKTTN